MPPAQNCCALLEQRYNKVFFLFAECIWVLFGLDRMCTFHSNTVWHTLTVLCLDASLMYLPVQSSVSLSRSANPNPRMTSLTFKVSGNLRSRARVDPRERTRTCLCWIQTRCFQNPPLAWTHRRVILALVLGGKSA